MGFVFGARSQEKLAEVNPKLTKLCQKALAISPDDFGIYEGLRTRARQAELVAEGLSQTMHSNHLTGHAVDIVVYPDGKHSWEIPGYFKVIDAFIKAASDMPEIKVRWGAAWHCEDLGKVTISAEELHKEYLEERRVAGIKPFKDAPHIEIVVEG